jgi:hypothetical protein
MRQNPEEDEHLCLMLPSRKGLANVRMHARIWKTALAKHVLPTLSRPTGRRLNLSELRAGGDAEANVSA